MIEPGHFFDHIGLYKRQIKRLFLLDGNKFLVRFIRKIHALDNLIDQHLRYMCLAFHLIRSSAN